MELTANRTFSLPGPSSAAGRVSPLSSMKKPRSLQDRKTVGQFVGNAFYGTLLKQVQESKMKGAFGHGGRGEEVFNGQLSMEFAKRIGQSHNDPLSERLYQSISKHAGKSEGGKTKLEATRR